MTEPGRWKLDEDAATFYEERFVPALFGRWAPILVEAGRVCQGEDVLDVGCGTGVVARAAAERAGPSGRVAGVDLNASMVGVARRLRPDLEWHEGDAASLPFEDGAFDAVLCQAALMFFPDRVAALREMRRVARAGGRVAALVWADSRGYDVASDVLERVGGAEAAAVFRAPFCLRDPRAVRGLFLEAGMPGVRVATREGEVRFPTLDAFVRIEINGWVLKGLVDVETMREALREPFREFGTPDGGVRVPIAAHIATAEV
jgi:SAM-dependent methyltransferase